MTALPPRLLQGFQAQFSVAEWPGENTSGLRAFGKHVLIRCDQCSEASAGGVLLPDDKRDAMTEAAETGCIYGMGSGAFRHHADGTRWVEDDKPAVGDRVYFERYAGVKAMGMDGNTYRMMAYDSIVAGLNDVTGAE